MMNTLHSTALKAAGFFAALNLFSVSLNAQNGASPLGKPNFSAYYTEVPMPPKTPAEAAQRTYGPDLVNPDLNALDNYYQPVNARIEAAAEEYQKYYANRGNSFYSTQNEATLRAQATAQADRNPIIAAMGGTEAVAQMSPEQAEAAARKAAAAYQADPFAANGVQSAGMTALYQKIVSDPAYAERFQKMSEAEREAELRKYMANDKVQAKTPAQMQQELQQREQQSQEASKVRSAMAFQQQISALSIKIQEAGARYEQQRASLLESPGNHHEIEAAFQKKYDAIPEVVIGEVRDKDPEQALRLRREALTQHRVFATTVLKQDAVLLAELLQAYQRIAAEYRDYMAAHRHEVNGNLADQMNGTETETMLANFEMGLLGLAQELIAHAKVCTRDAALWEKEWSLFK